MKTYWHVTSYRNWPEIRQHGIRPGADGKIWVWDNVGHAVHYAEQWSNPAVPACIVVLATSETPEPTSFWDDAFTISGVDSMQVFDVIRPEEIEHYRTDLRKFRREGSAAPDLTAIERLVADLRGDSRQLGICGRATHEVEKRFGYPKVEGFYSGPDYSGRSVWIPHAWNRLPNGDVLDPTSDQFGFPEGVRVVPRAQALAYQPFTPEQQRAREEFREENMGREPGVEDWVFLASKTAYMEHRPDEDGPPAHDLLAGEIMPPDAYERMDLYTFGYQHLLPETKRTLLAARGKPDARITVYRAQPKGKGLNHGDWVTLSRGYAEQDLASDPGGGRAVETYTVPASTVRFAGDDLMEWGYFGPSLHIASVKAASTITDYLDAVTEMFGQMPGRTYSSIDEVIRREGKHWRNVSKDLPPGVRRGPMGNCFGNALEAVQSRSDLIYVEGYAHQRFFPMKHAWVVDGNGTVYDVTWPEPATEYFGVAFNTDWLNRYVLRSGYTSVFGGIPHDGLLEILTKGHLPDEAINATGSLAVEAAEDYSQHAMICLKPSEALRKVYADMDECTEDLDDLHVTLYYLGEIGDEAGDEQARERLFRGLYDFGINAGYRGLTGKVNGFGCFMNEDSNVLISLWDIPGIAEFRTKMTEYVTQHGYTLRTDNHGFTPHMTLAYGDEPFKTLPDLPDGNPDEEHFVSLWLVWGEEWNEIYLS